jgi:hypothetical protein
VDFHHLLPAGLPAHCPPIPAWCRSRSGGTPRPSRRRAQAKSAPLSQRPEEALP